MGKYLKKIESSAITGKNSKSQLRIMNHYKDQPNNGTTIYAFKNPQTGIYKTAFLNNQNKIHKTTDKITNFTWRFVYHEGNYPYVIIKFTAINSYFQGKNAIIALETNTGIKRKAGYRNTTCNVFASGGDYADPNKRNITWKFIDDIVLNQEFVLYISGNYHKHGPWNTARGHNRFRDIPDDWKIKINIRPTIRFEVTTQRPYSNYKGLSEYREIEYFLKDEINLN